MKSVNKKCKKKLYSGNFGIGIEAGKTSKKKDLHSYKNHGWGLGLGTRQFGAIRLELGLGMAKKVDLKVSQSIVITYFFRKKMLNLK